METFQPVQLGRPLLNFHAGMFGRITTQEGDPRIIQFGIKYDFPDPISGGPQ